MYTRCCMHILSLIIVIVTCSMYGHHYYHIWHIMIDMSVDLVELFEFWHPIILTLFAILFHDLLLFGFLLPYSDTCFHTCSFDWCCSLCTIVHTVHTAFIWKLVVFSVSCLCLYCWLLIHLLTIRITFHPYSHHKNNGYHIYVSFMNRWLVNDMRHLMNMVHLDIVKDWIVCEKWVVK